MRLPSEVLPVVRVVTRGFVVLLIEWTPFSFEVEHIEIVIPRQVMNDPGFDVFLRVCKGAILPIFAVLNALRVLCTEASLVFFNVVESLYSVMREVTCLLFRAFVCFRILAKVRANFVLMYSSFIFT